MRRVPVALACALALAACSGVGGPAGLPSADRPPAAGDLRDVLDDLARPDADSLLAERLFDARLTPVYGSRFRLAGGSLAAFVPGRHPVRGRELVVVAAVVGAPGAAALLEEVRRLNRRAAYTVAPERTVLAAFLPRGGGPQSLASVLDAPIWVRSLLVGAVVVGDGGAAGAYEAVGVEREVPVVVLAVPGTGQRPVDEALALASALRPALAAAANGAPASPDVGVPPPDTLRGPRLPIRD
ncbi:MAG: hypothetical protein R3181_08510 [Rubricoccaceae bacterium]|nr:hypothetical protein [Rubricoccaceae bacterium]